ncbi:MAG TPA: LD-carboxypeptidase [Candidatus Dormibacteraeota bacterium]|nr:LD-carboxypeptidase [Candidatus Dormibacteraeota bacterium]
MPIKPERLTYGDTVGLISPASAPPDPKAIDRSVAVLERLGFKLKLGANARKRWGFLAGSDRDRASDLMNMFTDRKVKAIFCVRGGYGSARLLPLLDFKTIRAHPKIFVGYSDITSLHCALLVKSNLASFHGPMLNSELIEADCPEFTVQHLLRSLMDTQPIGALFRCASDKSKFKVCPPKLPAPTVFRRGKATGQLLGGNLSVLCTTLGTRWQPSFKKKILFLEDLAEVPYRLDRMLTHLLNAGVLQQVAGVCFGINHNCHDPKAKKMKEYRQTMEDVMKERLLPLRVPLVAGLPFGHILTNATVPIGVRGTLDGNRGDLVIEEPAVT